MAYRLTQSAKGISLLSGANDFRSKDFRIDVTAMPMITDWKVSYEYPGYTGLDGKVETRGDIQAVEGTKVDVEVTLNVPVAAQGNKIEFFLDKQFVGNNASRPQPINLEKSLGLIRSPAWQFPLGPRTDQRRASGRITLADDGSLSNPLQGYPWPIPDAA